MVKDLWTASKEYNNKLTKGTFGEIRLNGCIKVGNIYSNDSALRVCKFYVNWKEYPFYLIVAS